LKSLSALRVAPGKTFAFRRAILAAPILALAIIPLGTAAAATPPQIGVAFDQIQRENFPRPLPLPSAFDNVWNNALATGWALHSRAPKITTPRAGLLFHVATLGQKVRVENVFNPGLVELDTVGIRNAVFLDLAAKTYWEGTSRYYLPPVSAADIGIVSLRSSPQTLTASTHGVSDAWPSITVAGIRFDGRTTRTIVEANALPPCRPVQGVVVSTIFSAPAITEAFTQEELYMGSAVFLWPELVRLSGCSIHAAAIADRIQGYPGFLLYRAQTLTAGAKGVDLLPTAPEANVELMMRGHLRLLSAADEDLFSIPAGFREQSPVI